MGLLMHKGKSYGGGLTRLLDMLDVNISNPSNGDAPVYNSTSQRWKNIPIMTKEQWKKNGAYNLLENTASSQVVQGVTFTVNPKGYKKGAIKLYSTATPTGGVDFKVNAGFKLSAGTYKLVPNDFPSTANSSRISVTISGGAELAWDANYDNHAHCEFTLTEEKELIYHIYMNTASIGALNNIIIYPMITTDMNATPADFEEFAKTNGELTEDKYLDNSSSYTSLDTVITNTFTATANGLYLISAKCNNAISTADVYLQNGSSPILTVLGVDVAASQLVYLKAGTTLYTRSDKGRYVVRGYYKV